MKKVFLLLLMPLLSVNFVLSQGNVLGQEEGLNAIQTTVPFMTIAPDSRAGAMGDVGAATAPDLSSQHWNPAKYVFMEPRHGIALSYTPWLKNLGVTDLNLLYLSGYHKFDEQQAISGGLRYFNLGTINYTTSTGESAGTGRPNEFAIDLGYSRKFSDYFSGALLFRFIYSDISGSTGTFNNIDYNKGTSFASDLAVYYQRPLNIDRRDAEMAFGLDISNIGTKMAYSDTDDKEFIPTNMRLGGRFSMDLDEYNQISIAADVNKLLVPTPPDRDPDTDEVIYGKDDNVGPVRGIFQSFNDATYEGEEWQELMYSVGLEYWYRQQFAVRGGYFFEHENKGNRKYFTAGIGLKLNVFSIDFSYLVPSGGRTSPLANTMRFTLGFIFE